MSQAPNSPEDEQEAYSNQGYEDKALERIRECLKGEGRELDLDHLGLTSLPEEIWQLSRLERLNLGYNRLSELPAKIGGLSQLTYLDLSGNQLAALPSSLLELNQLKELFLHDNSELGIPESVLGPSQKEIRGGSKILAANPREILGYYFSHREEAQENVVRKKPRPKQTKQARRPYTSEELAGVLTRGEMSPQQQEEEDEYRLEGWRTELEGARAKSGDLKQRVAEGKVGREELQRLARDAAGTQKEIRKWFEAESEISEEGHRLLGEWQRDEAMARELLGSLPQAAEKAAASPTPPVTTPPAPLSFRSYSTFQSDVPPPEIEGQEAAVPDALKLGDYARHLAEMMGARETPLPLSLGLFGDWGTGKTHFMRLLREKMRKQKKEAGSPWCEHVVEVKFNAWHYLDANLWASLVTEIFDCLFKRVQVGVQTPAQAKAELLGKLEAANGAAAKAKEEVNAAKEAEAQAEKNLVAAQVERDAKAKTLAGELDQAVALMEIVKETAEGKQLVARWEELCKRLGWDGAEKSADVLNGRLAECRTLGGRFRLFLESAWGGKNRVPMLFLLLATLVVVPWVCGLLGDVLAGNNESLKRIGQLVGAVSGWMTALGGWLGFWTQKAQKYVGDAEELQRRLDEAQKKREETREVVEKRKELETAVVKAKAAEKGLTEAQARVRALQEELREQEPERRLLRFIGDRARAEDYRKHLGLVSLVRRDFETLSNLFAELQVDGRMKPKTEGSLAASVDRIILYVDDLDRCPASRVVEVLEAVHLLLAFPLFVVVVAVDPRWLQRSLRQHYPELLDEAQVQRPANGGAEGTAVVGTRGTRSASPLDYLEKIFHVPFHLPRMESEGYKELVAELTGTALPVERVAPVAVPSASEEMKADPAENLSSLGKASTGGSPKAEPTEQAKPPVKVPEATKTSVEVPEPPPQRVVLDKDEILALQEYGAFIRTPRAVKRLLNTYRLVRAGLSEVPQAKLPPGANMAERCAPAMLLLALSAGFPGLARELFAGVRKGQPLESAFTPEMEESPEFAELKLALGAWKGPREGVDWKGWVDRVGRFAF